MIQVSNLEELKAKDINNLVDLVLPELESRKVLWKRVHRKNDLRELAFDINGKTTNITFEKYISLITAGYFGGKAPVYQVEDTFDKEKAQLIEELFDKKIKDKNYKKKMDIIIDYISNYNDDSTEHYNLVKNALELRSAYEIIYENDNNEIVYSELDPLQTVAIWDYNTPKNLLGIFNIHTEKNVDGTTRTIVEITDKNGTRKFAKDNQIFEGDKIKGQDEYIELESEYENHFWGDVPGFAVELDESIFESEVDTIIKYQQLVKNTSNMFEYNDELAKLAIYGYSPENEMVIEKEIEQDGETKIISVPNPAREMEDRKVLDSKTLYFPEKTNGGAEWVLKEINDSAIQNTLKTFIDLILMMAGVPNTFDLGFTNADNASALDRKFFSLAMMTIDMVKQFEQGYKRRWELIFNRINIKKNESFDFRDVKIELPQNIPANESELIEMWTKLQGIISDETIVERLPLGLNYKNERNKIEEQNQSAMQANLEQVKNVNSSKNSQYEVGGKDGQNMELSQSTDGKTKKDISEAKQADTNKDSGNNKQSK